MGLNKFVDDTIDNTKKVVHFTSDFFGITSKLEDSRYEYPLNKFYFKFILYLLMAVGTALILAPVAYYLYCKDKYNNTFYNNKKVVFNGSIRGAYTAFISGFLLTIIVLLTVNQLRVTFIMDIINEYIPEKYVNLLSTAINVLPTILASSLIMNGLYKWGQRNANFVYDDTGSYLDKKIIKGILVAIGCKVLSFASFFIGTPFALWLKQRFIVNRMHVSHEKMKFNGNPLDSFKWFIWRYYLIIVTAGIYYPIYIHKINKWTIMHMHLAK